MMRAPGLFLIAAVFVASTPGPKLDGGSAEITVTGDLTFTDTFSMEDVDAFTAPNGEMVIDWDGGYSALSFEGRTKIGQTRDAIIELVAVRDKPYIFSTTRPYNRRKCTLTVDRADEIVPLQGTFSCSRFVAAVIEQDGKVRDLARGKAPTVDVRGSFLGFVNKRSLGERLSDDYAWIFIAAFYAGILGLIIRYNRKAKSGPETGSSRS